MRYLNKLQSVVRDLGVGNEKIYTDLLRELKNGKSINDAFRLAEYNNRLKINFIASLSDTMHTATLGTAIKINSDEAVAWYMQQYDLSDRLRSQNAKRVIENELSKHFRFNSSVQRLQKTLPTSQYGRLPNDVKKMMSLYNDGVSNSEVSRAIDSVRDYVIRSKRGDRDSQLHKSYRALSDAVESNNDVMIRKTYARAVKEKIAYMNERIARTEVARAYQSTTLRAYREDENTAGARWLLSPLHPETDICDYYADYDGYGIGAGGYPLSEFPNLPAHPMCLCMVEPIKIRPSQNITTDSGDKKTFDRVADEMSNPEQLQKQIKKNDINRRKRDKIPKSVLIK